MVRGMVAECLANLGKRKAIRVLIDGSADESGTYWPIRWEALAMLSGAGWKSSADECFRTAILTVLRDPLHHRDLWQWATFYWHESLTNDSPEARGILDAAVQTIHDAGFDPVWFADEAGRAPTQKPR